MENQFKSRCFALFPFLSPQYNLFSLHYRFQKREIVIQRFKTAGHYQFCVNEKCGEKNALNFPTCFLIFLYAMQYFFLLKAWENTEGHLQREHFFQLAQQFSK